MNLRVKNLTKRFEDKLLFENLSLDFDSKGLYLITGESGIGKTTLLRILAGLDKEYEGEVTTGVGYVSFAFQEYRLFPGLTALENLIFAISDRKDEAVINKSKQMLSSLGFTDGDMSLYPGELSGGMKQRVSLARAFIFDVPVLLLDEPTKELDPENADRVRAVILKEAERRLVIMVSHMDGDFLPSAKRIVL